MALLLVAAPACAACGGAGAICPGILPGALPLIAAGRAIRVLTDPHDDAAVHRAAEDLTGDLGKVAGGPARVDGPAVIVGTIGHNAIIDRLIADHRLAAPQGWEAFTQQVVAEPAPGISRALVIVGSDRRGTIYGAYDLSRRYCQTKLPLPWRCC